MNLSGDLSLLTFTQDQICWQIIFLKKMEDWVVEL